MLVANTKIPAFISVRSKSSRLPRKCFLPFGNVTVIEHIILRALHYGLDPVICTTEDQSDDEIIELAIKNDVKFYRGPTENKLLRWSLCCEHFGFSSFHTVDADDPFFDGDEVFRSYRLLKSGYDMVSPSPSSSDGGATVGYSLTADIVDKATIGTSASLDTEMMWSYIERVKGLKKTILSDPENYIIKNRMTLDYYEDYVLLESVRLIAGNFATRKQIYKVLDNNKDLCNINSFRSEEWSENQKIKSLAI